MWDQLINVLTGDHDAAVQMIDTSIVRVHLLGTDTETSFKLSIRVAALLANGHMNFLAVFSATQSRVSLRGWL